MITLQQKIDMICAYTGISRAELSRRLGFNSPQAFYSRFVTGKFTINELEKMAEVTGSKYECSFTFPDGTVI